LRGNDEISRRAIGDGLGRAVVQREWAAKNPRATSRTPITVEDVLNSRMIPPRSAVALSGNRWRRGPDPGRRAAREGLPAKAGLPYRHRRERRDADGHGVGGMFAAPGTISISNEPL